MIEIRNVTKNYKQVQALDNISCTFEKGKIYGLLGRNGAGKSTLLKIMSNRIFASDGDIIMDGGKIKENPDVLQNMYCMSEENLYPDLKIKDIFKWTNEFYESFDLEKAYEYASMFQLNLKKENEHTIYRLCIDC